MSLLSYFGRGTIVLTQSADATGMPVAVGSAATQVSPTINNASNNGTISAGSRGLTFVFSANFAGTILGAAFSGANDSSLSIPVPYGCTLNAVSYTVTSGSVKIIDVR